MPIIPIIRSYSNEVYTATMPDELTQYIESEAQSLLPTVLANSGIYSISLTWFRDNVVDKEAYDKFSEDIKYIASHPNVRANVNLGSNTTADINSRFDNIAIHTALVYYAASGYEVFLKYGFWAYDNADYIKVIMFVERITEGM